MAEIKEKIGGFRFVDAGVGTYAINMSLGNNELSSFFNGSSSNWDGDPVTIAGVRVVPWGIDNNLPKRQYVTFLKRIIWDRAFWIAKQV